MSEFSVVNRSFQAEYNNNAQARRASQIEPMVNPLNSPSMNSPSMNSSSMPPIRSELGLNARLLMRKVAIETSVIEQVVAMLPGCASMGDVS